MKKLLKGVGIIALVYAVLDILVLAFIGCCTLWSKLADIGSVWSTLYTTWDEAIENFKKYWFR